MSSVMRGGAAPAGSCALARLAPEVTRNRTWSPPAAIRGRLPDGIAVDHDGLNLPDDMAALRAAKSEAHGIAQDIAKGGDDLRAQAIVVKDDTGRFLAEVGVDLVSYFAGRWD